MSQSIAPARLAAFDILTKMETGAGHCDELLRTLRIQSLSPQDRNLCTNLVMGTLRWQIALDARVTRLLSRPDAALAPGVRIALRLGAFQLLHLDRIPAHAAISESVELAKFGGEGFAAGMVNAVLRKIAVAGPPKIPASFRNVAELAAAYAHPAWMVERWASFYGMARAQQICAFNQQPPPTTLRLTTDADPNSIEDALAAEGITLGPSAFLTRARTLVHGDVTGTETYRTGKVRIQDEGSQLVAELAGQGIRPSASILDCCAAPGGKTAILAERNPNSTILACDVSARRMESMKGQMKRLLHTPSGEEGPGSITFQVTDIANLNRDGQFDLVLCDVPCSGTGTLARNPEIRHRMTPEAIPRHHQRQVEILRAAMRAVAPNGRLIYATCSLEPEENEAVVDAVLQAPAQASAPDFHRSPFDLATLAEANIIRPDAEPHLRETAFVNGNLRTIPGVHPCDGFFAVALVKA